jgi:DNA-directed RNA polymerase subunit RPC12/RpoP
MFVSFRCPSCGHQLRASATAAGKVAKCKCGQTVLVPKAGASSPPVVPPGRVPRPTEEILEALPAEGEVLDVIRVDEPPGAAVERTRPATAADGYIRFSCPKCKRTLKARPGDAGKTAHCQTCRQRLLVPTPNQNTIKTPVENKSRPDVPSKKYVPDLLDDPMLELRRFFGRLILWEFLLSVALCGGCVGLFSIGQEAAATLASSGAALCVFLFPYSYCVWRLLPSRHVDVFYLRSFRHDSDTVGLRVELQRAFGRRVRVSGICDPRRRWPKFVRFAFIFAFALRYATPRHLNLEAGENWKERLWRSLGKARGAVIDVSELTTHVTAEMQLCYRCLGLDRILFVGRDNKSVAEWQGAIKAALGRPASAPNVHLALWGEDQEVRQRFRSVTKSFAGALPASEVGYKDEAGEMRRLSQELQGLPRERAGKLWLEILIGLGLGILISTVLGLGRLIGSTLLNLLLTIPYVTFGILQLWYFVLYVKDCGSNRERFMVTATNGTAFLLPFVALAANRQVIAYFFPTVHRLVSVAQDRQLLV